MSFTGLICSSLWLEALVVLNGLGCFVIKSRNLINICCTCTRVTNINFLCNYLNIQSREKLTRSNKMITNAQKIRNSKLDFFLLLRPFSQLTTLRETLEITKRAARPLQMNMRCTWPHARLTQYYQDNPTWKEVH